MRRPVILGAVVLAVIAVVVAGTTWVTHTAAQSSTPVMGQSGMTTLTVNEHNLNMTDVDLGAAGPSAGDLRVWGPNPIFDEANATDTGASSQGSCVSMDAEFNCVLAETMVFPDGSTLEIQGVRPGRPVPSMRTIVGGSGEYLGATGTIAVSPTEDLTVWTKTIQLVLP
jgi:Flp pilus assembly protein CpaB